MKPRPGRFPSLPETKAEAWLSSALPWHPLASVPWSFSMQEDKPSLRKDAYAGALNVCSSGPWVRTGRQKVVYWSRNGHPRACFHRSPFWPRVCLFPFPNCPWGDLGQHHSHGNNGARNEKGTLAVCVSGCVASFWMCALCFAPHEIPKLDEVPGSTMLVGRVSCCSLAAPWLQLCSFWKCELFVPWTSQHREVVGERKGRLHGSLLSTYHHGPMRLPIQRHGIGFKGYSDRQYSDW